MTQLVDEQFYKEEYVGVTLPDGVFNRYEKRAEDKINEYTADYFIDHNLSDLPFDSDRLQVKKAICAQIEYFNDLKGTTELASQKGQVKSATIGKFNYSKSAISPQNKSISTNSIEAIRYLYPTGLLYRGMNQYG